MFRYGFRGRVYDWFANYLADRRQYVVVNGLASTIQSITHGVPQGSILGTLSFLLYINDLPNVLKNVEFVIYADNTTVLMPANYKPTKANVRRVQNNLDDIMHWFVVNRLLVNVVKTHAMFSVKEQHEMPALTINNTAVLYPASVRFFGCHIDPQLKWNLHAESVCTRLSRGVAILRACHNLFPKTVKLANHNALVSSYLAYCITAWGNACTAYVNPIIVLQKRAIRLVSNADRLAHTAPLASNLCVLLFDDIYKVRCLSLLFNIMHRYIELPLSCEIVHVNDTTEHFLRNANDFASIGCRLSIRQSSFVFAPLLFWKDLPNDIRCMIRLKQFTVACKNMCLAT
jgi:hypothetical protein